MGLSEEEEESAEMTSHPMQNVLALILEIAGQLPTRSRAQACISSKVRPAHNPAQSTPGGAEPHSVPTATGPTPLP